MTDDKTIKRLSKYLSLVLRHQPGIFRYCTGRKWLDRCIGIATKNATLQSRNEPSTPGAYCQYKR